MNVQFVRKMILLIPTEQARAFLQITTQNLHPNSHPPQKTYPQVGVGNEISEQVVLPLTTPSTPVTSVTIPIPVSKTEKKKMSKPRGFAEENSLRNMLEPQLHTDSIEGRYCLKISSVFLKDINISLIEVM